MGVDHLEWLVKHSILPETIFKKNARAPLLQLLQLVQLVELFFENKSLLIFFTTKYGCCGCAAAAAGIFRINREDFTAVRPINREGGVPGIE